MSQEKRSPGPNRRAGRRRQVRWVLGLVAAFIAAAGLAHSQLEIDRWTVDGGGRSSSGALRVDGTAGQLATSVSTGGALRIGGGFWISQETTPSDVPSLETLPERFASHGFSPNPVGGRTTLTLDLPSAMPVRVEAYAVDGSRVAVMHDATVSAGRLRLGWNATGDDGRRLASGVYLINVQAGANRATERVIVIQ